ncbi:cupin domain-containing protein [Anaeromusa acidaminophila]|uniref:cupin domain-containing protein n=1 Tax=Anaeromusa acidaminophila TaxID=81464 RepID=UPI0003725F2C|nr:cupin domain-containing protein [Anaeromusa acidaminophila]
MKEVKLFDVNEAEWKDWKEGMRACVFKATPQATMQYNEIKPEVVLDPHSHPAEQLTCVQQGFVDMTVNDKTYSLGPGCFCYIPSGAVHSAINRGNTTCVIVDVFMPERDDREHSKKIKDMGHNW